MLSSFGVILYRAEPGYLLTGGLASEIEAAKCPIRNE
jgi:hypothetical protein